MSIVYVTYLACAVLGIVIVVPVVIVVAWRERARRRAPQPVAPTVPDAGPLRVLYCVVSPVLAFAVVTALIVLYFAGPCGLGFGVQVGGMLLAFGGVLVPAFAAALALVLALLFGRPVAFSAVALAVIVATVMIVYENQPHQPAPTTYDPTNSCQLQGP